jgi:hypothetical protein
MSDGAEWRIEKLRQLTDLQGWEPYGHFLQDAGTSPLSTSDVMGIRLISVEDLSFGGRLENELAKDVRFAVQYSDDQEITYKVRFSRVRDTDLSTLPHVRKFLTERLGTDEVDDWNGAYSKLLATAGQNFQTRLDELTKDGRPKPSLSRADRDARQAEFDAWNRRYESAVMEAHTVSQSSLQINGQGSQQVWDMAIHQFCLRDHERKIMELVSGDGMRSLISDMFYQIAREAYVLGRWIRESEIVRDHGQLIEGGKLAKAARAAGGTARGQAKAADADKWRVPGLALAVKLREKDTAASQEDIARQIQDKIDDAPAKLRGITKAIQGWETDGKLPKRIPASKGNKQA